MLGMIGLYYYYGATTTVGLGEDADAELGAEGNALERGVPSARFAAAVHGLSSPLCCRVETATTATAFPVPVASCEPVLSRPVQTMRLEEAEARPVGSRLDGRRFGRFDAVLAPRVPAQTVCAVEKRSARHVVVDLGIRGTHLAVVERKHAFSGLSSRA